MVLFSIFGLQTIAAEGQMEEPQATITVRGTGSVAAAPDVVRLNLGVQTMHKDLSIAITDNENRIKAVIGVINEYGISETDYSTSNFSVYYQQPYGQDSRPEDGTYNVNNNIYIEVTDIEKIGGFIQDALSAGANQFYGLEYAISDPEPLMKQARRLAVENAAALAAETAGLSDMKVDAVISIEETPYYGGGMYFAERSVKAMDSNSITTIPGEKSVETQVTIVYSLR